MYEASCAHCPLGTRWWFGSIIDSLSSLTPPSLPQKDARSSYSHKNERAAPFRFILHNRQKKICCTVIKTHNKISNFWYTKKKCQITYHIKSHHIMINIIPWKSLMSALWQLRSLTCQIWGICGSFAWLSPGAFVARLKCPARAASSARSPARSVKRTDTCAVSASALVSHPLAPPSASLAPESSLLSEARPWQSRPLSRSSLRRAKKSFNP